MNWDVFEDVKLTGGLSMVRTTRSMYENQFGFEATSANFFDESNGNLDAFFADSNFVVNPSGQSDYITTTLLSWIVEHAKDGSTTALNEAVVAGFAEMHRHLCTMKPTAGSTCTVCCLNATQMATVRRVVRENYYDRDRGLGFKTTGAGCASSARLALPLGPAPALPKWASSP